MSSLESRLAAAVDLSMEGQSRPLDPGVTDPDFDVCVVARQQMTDPCGWTTESFCRVMLPRWRMMSCWGGHILRALGASRSDLVDFNQIPRGIRVRFDDIARKLGFSDLREIYQFNDRNLHRDVLYEFDRRLQHWGDA